MWLGRSAVGLRGSAGFRPCGRERGCRSSTEERRQRNNTPTKYVRAYKILKILNTTTVLVSHREWDIHVLSFYVFLCDILFYGYFNSQASR